MYRRDTNVVQQIIGNTLDDPFDNRRDGNLAAQVVRPIHERDRVTEQVQSWTSDRPVAVLLAEEGVLSIETET